MPWSLSPRTRSAAHRRSTTPPSWRMLTPLVPLMLPVTPALLTTHWRTPTTSTTALRSAPWAAPFTTSSGRARTISVSSSMLATATCPTSPLKRWRRSRISTLSVPSATAWAPALTGPAPTTPPTWLWWSSLSPTPSSLRESSWLIHLL